jgi:GT2 family glycosyltransferase
MRHHKKVIVIVVTYNGESCIDYCFGSLDRSTYPVDVLCIDNNSSDNTVKRLEEKYPKVELIKSDKNLGFGRANNIGLKRCIDDGYDYAFLLNQDARIEPDVIGKLVTVHENDCDYGILSPVHRSKNNDALDHRFSVYIGVNWTEKLLSDALLGVALKDVYETKFANAALWLVSRACLEKVNNFDPIFEHYGEDSEFAYRVKKNGMKIGIVPKAYGNHLRYSVENTDNSKKLNSKLNRSYSRILLKYKRTPLPTFSRVLFFIRTFISEIFYHAIMLEFKLFILTIYNYMRLFYDLLLSSIKNKK